MKRQQRPIAEIKFLDKVPVPQDSFKRKLPGRLRSSPYRDALKRAADTRQVIQTERRAYPQMRKAAAKLGYTLHYAEGPGNVLFVQVVDTEPPLAKAKGGAR